MTAAELFKSFYQELDMSNVAFINNTYGSEGYI
jgi:hypothetical protein